MIVIMKKEATEEQIKKVVDHIEKEGFKVSIDQGTERVVIGLKVIREVYKKEHLHAMKE